jgi:tRNA(Glu) U13 pseudouridine synthase TruD
MKEYADTAAKAKTHTFQVDDTVLVRQKRVNELFSPNNKHQYTIVKIKDSMITTRNATSYITRNSSQFKKITMHAHTNKIM